jgi:hypothetical protein
MTVFKVDNQSIKNSFNKNGCLTDEYGTVKYLPCKGDMSEKWTYKNKKLINGNSNKCLAIKTPREAETVMKNCDDNDDTQDWNYNAFRKTLQSTHSSSFCFDGNIIGSGNEWIGVPALQRCNNKPIQQWYAE